MIVKAAIRKDGKIYTGKRHAHIKEKADPPGSLDNQEEGFVDENGQFFDRCEAGYEAFKCGQIKKETNYLISDNLW